MKRAAQAATSASVAAGGGGATASRARLSGTSVLFSIHVRPGAKGALGVFSTPLEPADGSGTSTGSDLCCGVEVRTPVRPVDGAANAEVVREVAAALRVPRGSVAILRGHTSKQKVLSVDGLSVEEVNARLASLPLL